MVLPKQLWDSILHKNQNVLLDQFKIKFLSKYTLNRDNHQQPGKI